MFGDILFALMSGIFGAGGIAIGVTLFNELRGNPFTGANFPLAALDVVLIGLSIGLIIMGVLDFRKSYARRKEHEMGT